jgi:integrase
LKAEGHGLTLVGGKDDATGYVWAHFEEGETTWGYLDLMREVITTHFPMEKRAKYVPSKEDVFRVILAANSDTRDYLWTIALTMGRMSEVNRLTWSDVNFNERCLVLYTRKKRGGHFTPREVPMPDKLYCMVSSPIDMLWETRKSHGFSGTGTGIIKGANG